MRRDVDTTVGEIECIADSDVPTRGRVVFRGYEVGTALTRYVEIWPLLRADAARSLREQIDAMSAHELIEFRRMT